MPGRDADAQRAIEQLITVAAMPGRTAPPGRRMGHAHALMLRNLLDNAIRYGGRGCEVTVSVARAQARAQRLSDRWRRTAQPA